MPRQEYINQIIQDEFAANFPPPDQEMVEAEHPAVEHGMTEAFPANNINENPPISPLPVLAPATFQQNLNLASIRAQFNPEGMLRSSRGRSTFANHQRENTALIFYLYEKLPTVLCPEFCHELEDEDHSIDNVVVYDRRYRGRLTLSQRIAKHRRETIKACIAQALGPPGTTPPTQTVNFDAFTSDPEIFIGFIMTKKKGEEEELMKPGVYAGYRSNLTYLFRRYRYRPPPEYTDNLREYMEGVKRIANMARANGEVSTLHYKCFCV